MFKVFTALFVFILTLPRLVNAGPALSDDDVRKIIVQGSIKEFIEKHGKESCPCPYYTKDNVQCGSESAYFNYGENEETKDKPKCYPADVAEYEVKFFKSHYGIK